MDVSIIISVLLEIAVISSCILLIAILIITKSLPKRISKFGVLLFTTIAFISFFYLTINLGWINIAKPIIWLFVPSTLALGYWFYKFNTDWYSEKSKLDLFLLIVPVLTIFGALLIEVLFALNESSEFIYKLRITFTQNTLLYLFPLYSLIIIGANIYRIRKAAINNLHYYSNIESINIRAAKISLIFFSLFILGMVTSELTGPFISEFVFNLSFLGLTFYLGYYEFKVIANYLQLARSIVVENAIKDSNDLKEKPAQTDNALFQKIDTLVNDQKLYLKADFSLYDLGQLLEMNVKFLSQAINEQEGLNFNKFINEKRIDFAANLLHNSEYNKYSIEGIAMESGFRSKSTFNAAFKAFKSCTPSEYRSQLLNN